MIPNSEKKSETVRISKKDLLKLLSENERLKAEISALENKCDAAIDLAADYKEAMNTMEAHIQELEKKAELSLPAEESHIYNPNIYFDGSQGLP